MREGIRVREITNEEGNRLLRIVRRSSGSVVTWRRAQMVLLSAQGMDVAQIAKVAFTSSDRVRRSCTTSTTTGSTPWRPVRRGPAAQIHPPRAPGDQEDRAVSRPVDHDLPFSTWSLSKLAEFFVAEGVVDDISHEGLRVVLREEGVSFQVIKTYKQSNDPDFEAKKNRVLELYEIADGKAKPRRGTPASSSAWTSSGRSTCSPVRASSGRRGSSSRERASRDPGAGDAGPPTPAPGGPPPHGRLRPASRTRSTATSRPRRTAPRSSSSAATCARSTHRTSASPSCWTTSARTSRTKMDTRVGDWAEANNVELAYVPTNASWMNRIEAQFQALRYFTLDGTDHRSHEEQNSMIRRYIVWRNRNAQDKTLRELVKRANVA